MNDVSKNGTREKRGTREKGGTREKRELLLLQTLF